MSENTLVTAAMNKAMALCARNEYCSNAIRLKLKSWGVNDSEAESILTELEKQKFIDDKRYTAAFVKDRFVHFKWGKIKIASHLRMDNIDEEAIKSALEEIDEDVYKKAMKDIINGHRRSVKAKNQYDMKGKLLRYGLSKGFESHLLYDILNDPDE